jgi:hypothetical protein
MNKIIVALAALLASAICAPAAQAYDCDPEEIAEGECGRAMRMPGLRQLVPPAVRQSAAAAEECDADDAAELRECLRGLKASSGRQFGPSAGRTATAVPAQEAPNKTAAVPPDTAVASSETSAKLVGPDAASLCQRYFPNIGQSIPVPCGE